VCKLNLLKAQKPPDNLPNQMRSERRGFEAEGGGDTHRRPWGRWREGTDGDLASFYVCCMSPES